MRDKHIRILIVDDFDAMRKVLRHILRRELGYENILEANDGEPALEILKSRPVDLVFCDWNMPNMTGLELLKTVRADEKLKDLPFVMVTAEAQKENIIQAVQAKVSQYIVKPFTAETVEEKIRQVLGN